MLFVKLYLLLFGLRGDAPSALQPPPPALILGSMEPEDGDAEQGRG
jgi:hypothetical protein